MLKKIAILLLVLVLVASAFGYRGYRNVLKFEVEAITDDLSVVYGFGSNVGVLRTDFGPVVVDTMTFAWQGAALRERIEEFGGGKPVAIINTHYHIDHTHGNPAFPSGIDVIATTRTKQHLLATDADYWTGDAASMLPGVTFDGEYETEIGGQKLKLHHFGRGHTDGDLVVEFPAQKTIHTGDLFFHHSFPNIDLEGGGSIREWIPTIDRILELEFEHVIPGHGPVATRSDLVKFQSFLKELLAAGEHAKAQGWTLEETLDQTEIKSSRNMEDMVIPFVLRLDHDFVVQRSWEEATGAIPYSPPTD